MKFLREVGSEKGKMSYSDLDSLFYDIFDLLIFIRNCLVKMDIMFIYGSIFVRFYSSKYNTLLIYTLYLIDIFPSISGKKDNLLSYFCTHNSPDLM